MKIAQIVITRTKDGDWKLTMMSRKQTEDAETFDTPEALMDVLMDMMCERDWEELSL